MKPVLLGVPFENGIRMMQRFRRGVTGAAEVPGALFERVAAWPVDRRMLDLERFRFEVTPATRDDPAAVRRDNALTLAGHDAISDAAEAQVRDGSVPVAVGGDHSIAYALVRGLCRARPGRRLGVVYLDAHLDLRPLEEHAGVAGLVSSGNSFRRILEDPALPVRGRNVAAVGVHRTSSKLFTEMERYAREREMTVVPDEACTPADLEAVAARAVAAAADGTDGIYLSLDLDAVEAGAAPGVSAPAERGLPREVWLGLVRAVAARADLVGVDLAEASRRRRDWRALYGEETRTPLADPASFSRTLELVEETVEVVLAAPTAR